VSRTPYPVMLDSATEGPQVPPPSHGPDPRWGITWHGEASPETVANAIEAVSTAMGLRCQRWPLPSGAVEIETVQEASWLRTLTRLLPQRVLWRIEGNDKDLTVTADFRAFHWFQALVLGLFVLGLTLPLVCFWALNQPWINAVPSLRPVLGIVALLAPCMVVVVPTLLGILGGGRVGMSLWQPLLKRVEKSGGVLEPAGTGISHRYVVSLVIMTLLLVAAVSPLVWLGLRDLGWYHPVTQFSLLLLAGLAGVTLLAASVLGLRRGAGLRTEPVLVGVVTSVSVLFLFLPTFVFTLAGFDAATLEGIDESGGAAGWGAQMLFFVGLLVSVGVFPTAKGIRSSIPGWLVLERLHRYRDRGVYRLAVKGGPLLRLLRRIFVGLWALSAVVVAGGLGLVGLMALGSTGWPPFVPETGVADILAAALAFVLGRPWDDPVLSALARIAFLVYGLGLIDLFTLSVGQLWWARRRTRRDLLEETGDSPQHRRVRKLVAELRKNSGLGPICLAVRKTRPIEAYSHAFGLFGQERFLEISEGALRHLTDEELRALIAHEMVHQRRRHVQTHNRLRWLGRLTFVGDGFVRALLDSFGDEVEADRAAVLKVGVPAEALLHCLWKIQNVNRFARQKDRTILEGLPASLERPLQASGDWRKLLTEELTRLTRKERWHWAWRLFVWQYFVPMDLNYWHPGRGDREAALRTLMEAKPHA